MMPKKDESVILPLYCKKSKSACAPLTAGALPRSGGFFCCEIPFIRVQ